MTQNSLDLLSPNVEKLRNPGLIEVTDGPWLGWRKWEQGAKFEEHTGPFYCRTEAGGVVCGFRPDAKNRNGGSSVHGGALMTFADYVIILTTLGTDTSLLGVTMTYNCEFVGAAEPGRLLTGRAEIVKLGFSVIFVRGLIDDAGRPVLTFSATIKRQTKRN